MRIKKKDKVIELDNDKQVMIVEDISGDLVYCVWKDAFLIQRKTVNVKDVRLFKD